MLCICSKDPGGEGYRPKEAESVYEFLMETGMRPGRVSIREYANRRPMSRYKCLLCNRDKFTDMAPHKCVGNQFRSGRIL